MRITYQILTKLRQALREYSKGKVPDNVLDNAIFKHFMLKFKHMVFENKKGILRAFDLPYWYTKGQYKAIRKLFKTFINK